MKEEIKMKRVKDLIEALQEYDQELPIAIYNIKKDEIIPIAEVGTRKVVKRNVDGEEVILENHVVIRESI